LGLGIEDLGTWTSVKKDGLNGKNREFYGNLMEILWKIPIFMDLPQFYGKENGKSMEILWKLWI